MVDSNHGRGSFHRCLQAPIIKYVHFSAYLEAIFENYCMRMGLDSCIQ